MDNAFPVKHPYITTSCLLFVQIYGKGSNMSSKSSEYVRKDKGMFKHLHEF